MPTPPVSPPAAAEAEADAPAVARFVFDPDHDGSWGQALLKYIKKLHANGEITYVAGEQPEVDIHSPLGIKIQELISGFHKEKGGPVEVVLMVGSNRQCKVGDECQERVYKSRVLHGKSGAMESGQAFLTIKKLHRALTDHYTGKPEIRIKDLKSAGRLDAFIVESDGPIELGKGKQPIIAEHIALCSDGVPTDIYFSDDKPTVIKQLQEFLSNDPGRHLIPPRMNVILKQIKIDTIVETESSDGSVTVGIKESEGVVFKCASEGGDFAALRNIARILCCFEPNPAYALQRLIHVLVNLESVHEFDAKGHGFSHADARDLCRYLRPEHVDVAELERGAPSLDGLDYEAVRRAESLAFSSERFADFTGGEALEGTLSARIQKHKGAGEEIYNKAEVVFLVLYSKIFDEDNGFKKKFEEICKGSSPDDVGPFKMRNIRTFLQKNPTFADGGKWVKNWNDHAAMLEEKKDYSSLVGLAENMAQQSMTTTSLELKQYDDPFSKEMDDSIDQQKLLNLTLLSLAVHFINLSPSSEKVYTLQDEFNKLHPSFICEKENFLSTLKECDNYPWLLLKHIEWRRASQLVELIQYKDFITRLERLPEPDKEIEEKLSWLGPDQLIGFAKNDNDDLYKKISSMGGMKGKTKQERIDAFEKVLYSGLTHQQLMGAIAELLGDDSADLMGDEKYHPKLVKVAKLLKNYVSNGDLDMTCVGNKKKLLQMVIKHPKGIIQEQLKSYLPSGSVLEIPESRMVQGQGSVDALSRYLESNSASLFNDLTLSAEDMVEIFTTMSPEFENEVLRAGSNGFAFRQGMLKEEIMLICKHFTGEEGVLEPRSCNIRKADVVVLILINSSIEAKKTFMKIKGEHVTVEATGDMSFTVLQGQPITYNLKGMLSNKEKLFDIVDAASSSVEGEEDKQSSTQGNQIRLNSFCTFFLNSEINNVSATNSSIDISKEDMQKCMQEFTKMEISQAIGPLQTRSELNGLSEEQRNKIIEIFLNTTSEEGPIYEVGEDGVCALTERIGVELLQVTVKDLKAQQNAEDTAARDRRDAESASDSSKGSSLPAPAPVAAVEPPIVKDREVKTADPPPPKPQDVREAPQGSFRSP